MMSNWNVPGLEAKSLDTGHFHFCMSASARSTQLPLILPQEHQLGRLTQAIPSKLPLVAFNCSDNELRLSRSN